MATECISREDALDFLIPADDLNISAQDKRVIADRFSEFIKSIPAADVRPVVRGKWIPQLTQFAESADICTCSVCGDTVWIYKDNSHPWNSCPNCGADMRDVKTV